MNHSTSNNAREFDVVLFGATSFVGKLTVDYLVRHHPQLKLAVAGRSESKLHQVVGSLSTAAPVPIIVADAADLPALNALAERTRVVISTVGPYTHYGDKVVEACVMHGTHYVALCGEALFIRRTIDQWHEKAQETGAKIVHSFVFYSVTSDM